MAWAALLAGAGYADTLVQWGERPTGAGTPGTNIVSANQNFIGSGTTYSGLTNNPAVGANYYPESTGRSPHFSAAVSSTAYGGGRLVEGASNGDRIAAYGQNVPAASTYRGMVMWASNYFLITDRAMTVTNVVLSIQQRSNANTTDQGVRVVVQQGSSFYASDAQVFGANYLTQTFAFASATWYEFTPFSSGAESIGSSVAAPSFNNLQAIGYYFTARNGGAAAGAVRHPGRLLRGRGLRDAGGGVPAAFRDREQPRVGQRQPDRRTVHDRPAGGAYRDAQQLLRLHRVVRVARRQHESRHHHDG
jgi:hypothetical protein